MGLKDSYVISTQLKSLMEAAGHKQLSIAQDTGLSEKTIGRALAGKQVIGSTVKTIAKSLNCLPQDLTASRPAIWVLSRGGEFLSLSNLTFKQDLFEVFKHIHVHLDPLNRELDSDVLSIVVDESETEIRLLINAKHYRTEQVWVFRPAVFDKSGVVYTAISEWEKFSWYDQRHELFRRLSDDITINDVEQITKKVKPGWHVIFGKASKFDSFDFVGEQRFPDDPSFRDSINEFLKTVEILKAEEIRDSQIILKVINANKLHQSIVFRRASFGPGGTVFPASLHRYLSDRILTGLSNPEVRRINCLAGFSDYQVPFGPCAKSTAIY